MGRLTLRNAVLGCLALLACLVSCAEPRAALESVSATVIFDWRSGEQPRQSLSVFASPAYQSERVRVVRAAHVESGLEWLTSPPRVLTARKSNGWAGYQNFVPAPGALIPQGRYLLTCTDAAGQDAQAFFSVAYDQELASLAAGQVAQYATQHGGEEWYALYDGEDVLIFWGTPKKSFVSAAAIKEEFPTATTLCRAYLLDGGATVCLCAYEPL